MVLDGITQEGFISALEARLNTDYTDEQKELITNFGTGPVFCFASPGTGKTYTAIAGLLNAELFRQIPGDQIYAMSFTNMATGELATRHERACRKLSCSRTVKFSTLHKLCRDILSKNYRKLGMLNLNPVSKMSMAQSYTLVETTCQEWGWDISPKNIRAIIRASESLNSALVFDEDNVRTKMAFKECGVEFDVFDRIRGLLFTYSLLTESINVSDIMLYTLMLMEKYPEVSTEFKAQCKMMLIDEAQDLSLLHLRIISMLTDSPVFIGDMKQQIYAFNGACQEIIEAFFKLFPNAVTTKLTQSFRCKEEIAKFATKIILHNKIGGEDFKGVAPGGIVQLHQSSLNYDRSGYSLEKICEQIRNEFVTNGNKFTRDYLFLFRNNTSAIPIVEELFKQGLPFRVNNYQPAYEVPVIKEMCELLQLCESPYSTDNLGALRYLIPEFRAYYDIKKHPFYEICKKTGCSIFEVNYMFKDAGTGSDAMQLLTSVREALLAGSGVGTLFNMLWHMYDEQWVTPNKWKLEATVEYYTMSVQPLQDKPFAQFVQDEIKKQSIIKESNTHDRGVRCYTMHASKGLEANVVYIMDAESTLIPNVKKLGRMVQKKCEMDAARAVREERALCYVACTRAKDELHIVYNDKPSSMLLGENPYIEYDNFYDMYSVSGDDILAFKGFVRRYVDA